MKKPKESITCYPPCSLVSYISRESDISGQTKTGMGLHYSFRKCLVWASWTLGELITGTEDRHD